MHTDTNTPRPSPQEFARLMDQAKREAVRLRHQAIADFWVDAAAAAVSAFARLRWPARRRPSCRQTAAQP